MRKTLYIHIGHYKTGTTALQFFLNTNRKKLLKLGLNYPERLCNYAKHSRPAFSLYHKIGVKTLMHGYDLPISPEDVWAQIFEEVETSPAPRAVISSEEFMRLGAHPAAVDALRAIIEPARARFDFRVIAYLRSPDQHLRSWYNQMVKMDSVATDFNTAVCQVMEPVHYDYGLALRPWVDLFGADAMILRPYQESLRRNGGLFRDFLSQCGLDTDKITGRNGWILPEEDVNPRLDDRLLDLARALDMAGVPEGLRPWALQRAKALLDQQDVDGRAMDFGGVVARASAGLAQLHDMVGPASAELAHLAEGLPVPDAPWRSEMGVMMAILLREQTVARDRLYQSLAELKDRVSALEAQQDPDD